MAQKILGAVVGGLVLGAAVAGLIGFSASLVHRPATTAAMPATAPAAATIETGFPERLMAQVAKTFVFQAGGPSGGAVFYEQPTSFGDVLCRIRRHTFAARVMENRPWAPHTSPDDLLEVTDVFAVRREPGAAEHDGGEAACKTYSDFDNLITGDDSAAIERAVNVLAAASRAARAGTARFKVVCIDRRQNQDSPVACDGLEILRAVKVRDIRQVTPLEDTWPDDLDDFDPHARSVIWRDQVWMDEGAAGRSCGQAESLSFKLTTLQVFGRHPSSDGELQAIKIDRDVIC